MWHVYAGVFARNVSRKAYGDFLVFRFARLYPLHLATLAVMLLEFQGASRFLHFTPHRTEHFTAWAIVNNLTLTQAWFPGIGAPNAPAWSISAEWFAYLLFPFLALVLWRLRLPLRVVALLACFLFFAFRPDPSSLEKVSFEFLAGMLFCNLSASMEDRRFPRFLSLAAGSMLIAAIYFGHALGQAEARALLVPIIGLMISGLAQAGDYGARILSLPMFVYLGEISYSIYMCHWAVWSSLRILLPKLLHGHIATPLLIGTALAIIILVSAAAYTWIEVPGRRLLRAQSRRIKLGRVAERVPSVAAGAVID
jgi:peptidoglycan/LPS O-acetylase OafA/YrhL